jgi:Ser/Thr protein kinase RdoA (MazF antagonist)
MSQKYFDRTGFSGDNEQLVSDIIVEFNLGKVRESEVFSVGYEDCNVKVLTDLGQYVIKAFAKSRDDEEIDRYIDIMQAAINGGVQHPALHKAKEGNILLEHPSGVKAVAMDYIDGKTYFDAKTIPTDAELLLIAKEAVKIHAIEINPPYIFDSWAIPNIHKMYNLTEQFLDDEGKKLARAAIQRYDAIDLNQLTKCFIHGDILSTNTLVGTDGKIWILDFACSNVYPKIQELAVMISSLLADENEFVPLSKRAERVSKAFLAAGGTLTDYEQQVLLDYAIGGATMEFLGGYKAKHIDDEDYNEAEYWLQVGKTALSEALFTGVQ